MLVSIIIPVFNEPQNNIEELRVRIDKVCRDKSYDYEILFVDDGSSNNILSFLETLHFRDKRIKVLSFGNNYGQASAFLAGLCHAKADIIIFMDADLQYSPEEMPYFIEKINEGYDAVGGKRKKESVGFLSKGLTVFLNIFSQARSSDYGCSYNAFRKEVAGNILSLGYPLCIKPLVAMLAEKKTEIGVTYNKRKHGESAYSFIGYVLFGIKYLLSFARRYKKQLTPPFKIVLRMLD